MSFRLVSVSAFAGIAAGCGAPGPYPAEIHAKNSTMDQCKQRIVDRGNAEPILIDEITSDTLELYAGIYQNGKPFACRRMETADGEVYFAAQYYETKWKD